MESSKRLAVTAGTRDRDTSVLSEFLELPGFLGLGLAIARRIRSSLLKSVVSA